MNLATCSFQLQISLFVGAKSSVYQSVEVTSVCAFLYIHAQSSILSEGDKPVITAVAHIEAKICRYLVHQSKRLAVAVLAKSERLVEAAQFTAEYGTQGGTA